MPLLELEPGTEEITWGTTRAQRSRINVTLKLTVVNSNPDYGVEYISGWARRIKIILNDPRRLQSWITTNEGKREFKWTLDGGMVPLGFLDSLVTDVDYKVLQSGSLRQADFSWFCLVHETLPQTAFQGEWPHYTDPVLGPPVTNANGEGAPR
jgi:hypothetical protein